MAAEGVKELPSSPEEVAQLKLRFLRHMRDSTIVGRDDDAMYCTLFDAGLVLVKLVVRAHGLRVAGSYQNHQMLIKLARSILGADADRATTILEHARTKRNHATYDEAGTISSTEVAELRRVVTDFERVVGEWIALAHPELLPPELPLS